MNFVSVFYSSQEGEMPWFPKCWTICVVSVSKQDVLFKNNSTLFTMWWIWCKNCCITWFAVQSRNYLILTFTPFSSLEYGQNFKKHKMLHAGRYYSICLSKSKQVTTMTYKIHHLCYVRQPQMWAQCLNTKQYVLSLFLYLCWSTHPPGEGQPAKTCCVHKHEVSSRVQVCWLGMSCIPSLSYLRQ